MKGRIVFLSILLVGFSLMGCAESPSKVEQILKGEHQLRKMAERTDVNQRVSASFFLFVGDLNAATETTVFVKFAWKMNDGVYAISSLPLEKIRVKIDESALVPTIKFCWRQSNYLNLQWLMDNRVDYAVVTVKESDWPVQVNLPLN